MEACQRTFEAFKVHLISDPVPPTDASESGLGAVLLQEGDGTLHPGAYAGGKLSKAGRANDTCEKECLALIFGIQKFN